MNLTRRILEGIHEVELHVAPEFQKPEREPKGVHFTVMMDTLIENGWQITSTSVSAPDKVTNRYYHPSLFGAAFVFSWDKGSGLVTDLASLSGLGLGPAQWDPGDVGVVAQLTKEWLEVGKKYEPTAEDEIGTVADMLGQIGWAATSDDAVSVVGGDRRQRVFEHPKVDKKIRAVYWKADGGLVTVLVLSPNDSPVSSLEASPESVYKHAQELIREVGV